MKRTTDQIENYCNEIRRTTLKIRAAAIGARAAVIANHEESVSLLDIIKDYAEELNDYSDVAEKDLKDSFL